VGTVSGTHAAQEQPGSALLGLGMFGLFSHRLIILME
jgi:hypothetical protein